MLESGYCELCKNPGLVYPAKKKTGVVVKICWECREKIKQRQEEQRIE